MNPASRDIYKLISTNELGSALRGDKCVFMTPAEVNDDMRPTDHCEFLKNGIYPLAKQHNVDLIGLSLEQAMRDICYDALGVFCAHQCFYIEIINEAERESAISINRESLPKFLADAFLCQADALHYLELKNGDLENDRSYKVILSGMRILERDHKIDWGISLLAL